MPSAGRHELGVTWLYFCDSAVVPLTLRVREAGSLWTGTWSERNGLRVRDILLTDAPAGKLSHCINFKALIGASVGAFNQAYSF